MFLFVTLQTVTFFSAFFLFVFGRFVFAHHWHHDKLNTHTHPSSSSFSSSHPFSFSFSICHSSLALHSLFFSFTQSSILIPFDCMRFSRLIAPSLHCIFFSSFFFIFFLILSFFFYFAVPRPFGLVVSMFFHIHSILTKLIFSLYFSFNLIFNLLLNCPPKLTRWCALQNNVFFLRSNISHFLQFVICFLLFCFFRPIWFFDGFYPSLSFTWILLPHYERQLFVWLAQFQYSLFLFHHSFLLILMRSCYFLLLSSAYAMSVKHSNCFGLPTSGTA